MTKNASRIFVMLSIIVIVIGILTFVERTQAGQATTWINNLVSVSSNGDTRSGDDDWSSILAVDPYPPPPTPTPIFSCSDVTEIPQSECEALVALYVMTDGDNWTSNDNWLQNNTPSNWYGLTVTGGYVRSINLSNNNLEGNLPIELGNFNLQYLQYLYVDGNPLTGSIPLSFVYLYQLDFFYFFDTGLCEPTTPEYLTWKDTVLDYQGTDISCGEFTCSDVTEIPQSECEALVALYAMTNGDNWSNNDNWLLNYTPSSWYGLTVDSGHVTSLSLHNNWLNGSIPSEIGNLGSLQYLALSRNALSGNIPPELGNLSELQVLSLYRNNFYGSIPPQLGNLTNLTHFNLGANGLSGSIPPEIGNLTALQVLTLDRNQLTGSIPSEIGNLVDLQHLWLFQNYLTGSIPPGIGNLTSLEYLELNNNNLSGSIPPEIGNLTSLQYLYLQNNQLSGSIPPELGNLTALQSLYLYINQLTGSIPPELGNLTALQSLYLYTNQLTGNIPPELGNLISLYYLSLSGNQLSGSIPPDLGNLTALNWFNLNSNQLSGSIPPELGNLTAVVSLSLSGNQLSGSIPPELGNLTILGYLGLSDNQLSGSIPPELGNLSHVWQLYLSDNQLTGSIPPELGNLYSVGGLSLSSNQLSGNIPPELGNLTNLQVLNLSDNQLSGSIPPELGNLTAVVSLSLSDNQLSGSIPSELGNLSQLPWLFLNNNQLSGIIPPELGNLTSLLRLWLNNNQLTGPIPLSITNLVNLYETYIGYNALYANDPAVVAFLETESPGWADTQTVAPGNFQGTPISSTEVELTWEPIIYTAGEGYYEVSYAVNEAGPYSVVGITGDKTTSSMVVDGLEPGETYYFRVRTFSAANWLDPAQLWSDYSPSISLITEPQPPEANFSATPLTGSAPLTVSFTNTSTGTYTNYAWDFGDESTSTEVNPTHTFYLAGAYTVSLSVSGSLGSDTETKTDYITVTALAEEEITPGEGGEVTFDPEDGGTVTIQVPVGAVSETILLQITENPDVTVPPDSALVGVSFNLTAILDGLPIEGYEFLEPVTIRVDYTDDQVAGLDEDSLRLYFWDEATETWLDAAQTCDPLSTYMHNPDENWFSVDICHLTQFAVFGEIEIVPEGYSLFLPATQK